MKLTRESMQVDGQQHTYALAVPESLDTSKTYPLVMVFHGNPGNADQMINGWPFHLASGSEAILAYPEGLNGNWDLSTPAATNKDFAFIKVLAAEIAKKQKIDLNRVFATGYSGGGFFLNQLNCRVPTVFKAFASHAGGAPFAMDDETANPNECRPCTGKVPAIHTHGKKDNDVGVDSGYYAANCWAKTNACSSIESNDWPATEPAPCKKAPGCDAAPVHFCWVDELGHGQWDKGSAVAWAFFKSQF